MICKREIRQKRLVVSDDIRRCQPSLVEVLCGIATDCDCAPPLFPFCEQLCLWAHALKMVKPVFLLRFYTFAGPCCFKAPVRREGQRIVTRFQLSEETDADLCSADPWLVLHKIDSPTKMRYIGNRMATCNASAADPAAIPPSLAPFVHYRGAYSHLRVHSQLRSCHALLCRVNDIPD